MSVKQKVYPEPTSADSSLNEPMAVYLTRYQTDKPFLDLLGFAKGNALASNDMDVLRLARQGFPKRVLLAIAKKVSLTIQELSDILHISERTLQRYDDDTLIKTEYAEKAIKLTRLYSRGEEVFGSVDKFKAWMRTPSAIFKTETPLSLLDTTFGFDMVFDELGRIEHGIFA